jgi:hypothetical protein
VAPRPHLFRVYCYYIRGFNFFFPLSFPHPAASSKSASQKSKSSHIERRRVNTVNITRIVSIMFEQLLGLEQETEEEEQKLLTSATQTTKAIRNRKSTVFVQIACGAMCLAGSSIALVSRSSEQSLERGKFVLGDPARAIASAEEILSNGQSYRGKQNRSRTGKECKSWVQTAMKPEQYAGDGLIENYCRNPGGVREEIFCFVGAGVAEACDALGRESVRESSNDASAVEEDPEVQRLEEELAEAEKEVDTASKIQTQLGGGEIVVTETLANEVTADQMDDTIASEKSSSSHSVVYQSDPDGSFASDSDYEDAIALNQAQRFGDETIVGNGQSYRGKQIRSKSGTVCKSWVQTTTTPDDNPTEGLEENYCRNPHGAQESIWCYVGGGQSEICDPLEVVDNDASIQALPEPGVESTIIDQVANAVEQVTNELTSSSSSSSSSSNTGEAAVGGDEEVAPSVTKKSAKDNFNEALERIEGDGTSYRGFQQFSKTGKPCKEWQYTQRTAFDYPDGDLLGNFCRNPDHMASIYCYVGNNVAELCAPMQPQKSLDNGNIKDAVGKCLQEAPGDGNCPQYGAKSGFGVMKNWDTSKVTNMASLFEGKNGDFNGDLSDWDVSQVTSMYHMFYQLPHFNSDLSNWDVSNCENFMGMFNFNAAFNRDLSNWKTTKAKTMQGMFKNAKNFNQDISNWDVSNCETFVSMFEGADQFNQPIGKWNTGSSKFDGMQGMFQHAKAFEQDVSTFKGQAASTNQGMMFSGASAFQAKFKCGSNADMGPPSTCVLKDTSAQQQQLGSSENGDSLPENDELGSDEPNVDATAAATDGPIEQMDDTLDNAENMEEEAESTTTGEEVETEEVTVQAEGDETVVDNGQAYRGKQTRSRSGHDCVNWQQTTMTPDDNPDQGLEKNYCRNPGGVQETIFCYIGGGETDSCDALI